MSSKTRVISSISIPVVQQSAEVQQKISAWGVQAKAADIPTVLGARLRISHCGLAQQGNGFYLSYSVMQERDEVVLFYQREMERLGWKLCATLVAQESVYIFCKPHHQAVILVSPGEHQSGSLVITVYVMDRQS